MDESMPNNPISTIQLIPVINYLNLLSDFLYTENFLNEFDQHKQVPIVNALHEYLERHHDNLHMQLKLIRNLLKGSDLYGEQENEAVDEVFVNAMFDYIISSLVFDKYGNIYGFLADTIRHAENLQYDCVLKLIKEKLKSATFKNEYGPSSSLTELSVKRIFNDIILPLFPAPLTNLNILSLDYSFAQAGASYLRLGRINNSYYSNLEDFNSVNSHQNLFDQYLATGYIIQLLNHGKRDAMNLRSFALPVLFNYISITQENFKQKNIKNIIFDPHHWERAYEIFFQHAENAFSKIEYQLNNDYTYKMHQAFSRFQSRAAMAKFVLDLSCIFLSKARRESNIRVYIENAKHYECRMTGDDILPNINNWYEEQINKFGELYEKYDRGITQDSFNESSIGDLRGIEIFLILTNDKVINDNFNTSQYFSYDFLQFYDTSNYASDYYALVRENNTVRLICENDNPDDFQEIIGPSKDDMTHSSKRIILKSANQSANVLLENLIKYKKDRFMSYLNYSDNSPEMSGWWKEFGLSLVPLYPCLSNITNYHDIGGKLCVRQNIHFLYNHSEDVSSHMIHNNTQALVTSFGTTIRTVFFKDLIQKVVYDVLALSDNTSSISENFDEITKETFYQKLALHIEEPKFQFSCFNKKEVDILETIFRYLKTKKNLSFIFIDNNMFEKMFLLESSRVIRIAKLGNKLNQWLFVNSRNNITGYGYAKYLDQNSKLIAKLTTDYESKDKIFISLSKKSSKNQSIYIKFKKEYVEDEDHAIFIPPIQNSSKTDEIFLKYRNGTLIPINTTDNLMYEINNQLWNKFTKVSFHGILIYTLDDDLCNDYVYLEKSKKFRTCLRHRRYIEKTDQDVLIVKDLLKNKSDKNLQLERQLFYILRMYTFSNDETKKYFFSEFLKNGQFNNSDWIENNLLDTTGMLNKLLYDINLENEDISILKAEERINSTHSYRERSTIEEERSLENIVEDFNNQKASYSVMFEDYYAIRNFATTGYKRIGGDTSEANLMKLALYKFAIRQFENFIEEFDIILYRFDSIPEETFQKQFIKASNYSKDVHIGKSIFLQKFTITSTSEKAAMRYAAQPMPGYRNVLYEMKFYDRYFRAQIDVDVITQSQSFREKQIILLPGSEFNIENVAIAPTESVLVLIIVTSSTNTENIEFHKIKTKVPTQTLKKHMTNKLKENIKIYRTKSLFEHKLKKISNDYY